ncbi:MAG: metallophosphoesterase [Gemmatimonadaceae bacterium]|nr:metallophosphoesterase [Gemmatimonadaceae bacterium]
MRLVHFSDVHLGFRQFQRVTPAGINQREADVARSFANAIEKTIELRPDLVLVAGDVFHTVRPTNPAILHAFSQFARLVRELPGATVVVVAGNHDIPRSSESTCILRLFRQLGVHVVDGSAATADAVPAQRLAFPEHDLSVLAVPEVASQNLDWSPDPAVRHNVLLAHGEVQGLYPSGHAPDDPGSLEIPKSVCESSAWDYIALGHHHTYRRMGPNAYYSGSLDYASTNVWGELAEQKAQKLPGKGLIERDLVTGRQSFHPLPVVREFVDLPPLDGRGLAAADLDAAIGMAVRRVSGGIEGKVVRLVARDVARHVVRELDHKALREVQRAALHFHLDTRRPDVIRHEGSGAPGRRPSLVDTLRERLRSRELAPGVDRERLIALGLQYLAMAEHEGAPSEAAVPPGDA